MGFVLRRQSARFLKKVKCIGEGLDVEPSFSALLQRTFELPGIDNGIFHPNICLIRSWESLAWKTFPLRMSSSPRSMPLFFLALRTDSVHPIPEASLRSIWMSALGRVSCIVCDCNVFIVCLMAFRGFLCERKVLWLQSYAFILLLKAFRRKMWCFFIMY